MLLNLKISKSELQRFTAPYNERMWGRMECSYCGVPTSKEIRTAAVLKAMGIATPSGGNNNN